MKYWYFVKWLYKGIVANIKSWDRWMWAWAVTCAWGPNAVMGRETNPINFEMFMWSALVFWVGYGLVYTSIKNAYNKFLEEQNKIIGHLKDQNEKSVL